MNTELENLSSEEIFGLSETQREEVLKAAVDVYIQQVELGSLLLEIDFISFLKTSIRHTELEIEKLTEEEQYETCYFLQEIIKVIKQKYSNGL